MRKPHQITSEVVQMKSQQGLKNRMVVRIVSPVALPKNGEKGLKFVEGHFCMFVFVLDFSGFCVFGPVELKGFRNQVKSPQFEHAHAEFEVLKIARVEAFIHKAYFQGHFFAKKQKRRSEKIERLYMLEMKRVKKSFEIRLPLQNVL